MNQHRHRPRAQSGYTLIELMIVVVIIGILAAVAIPQFTVAVLKTQEGTTKSNLGALRTALSLYYGDTEGAYPTDISCLTQDGRYLRSFPWAIVPAHP